jgi:hypothetical protein
VVTGPEWWKGNSKCNMLGAANDVVLLQVVGLNCVLKRAVLQAHSLVIFTAPTGLLYSVCRQINNNSYFIKFEAVVLAAKLRCMLTYKHTYKYIHAYIYTYTHT